MGLFSKIETTQVTKTGRYFEAGNYKIVILACKVVESQADPRHFFIIETRVLESDNDKIEVGGEYSQVIDLNNQMGIPNVKGFVAAASGVEPTSEAVNSLIEEEWKRRAADKRYGLDESEILMLLNDDRGKSEKLEKLDVEAITEFIVHESVNPLEGIEMKLECIARETKKSKENKDPNKRTEYFTKHVWSAVDAV